MVSHGHQLTCVADQNPVYQFSWRTKIQYISFRGGPKSSNQFLWRIKIQYISFRGGSKSGLSVFVADQNLVYQFSSKSGISVFLADQNPVPVYQFSRLIKIWYISFCGVSKSGISVFVADQNLVYQFLH